MSFDWNNAAEQSLAGALGLVPVAGPILSSLVYIFWPQGEDIWAQIESQVEQLINQELSQYEQEQVTNNLQGLQNALNDYLSALSTGDTVEISTQWIATDTIFDTYLPNFQSSSYQLMLLPLFAQFANMNLALLRDGVIAGAQWGWNTSYQSTIAQKLTDKIAAFTQYANNTYGPALTNVQQNTPVDNHACQPFCNVNQFVRQMTLTVLDFVQFWPYLDVTKYPNPVTVLLTREIYSDPLGTCDNSGYIKLPSPPTQPISQISVWAWDRIDAVQLTYPQGGGPGGVTITPRMGDDNAGSNPPKPPYGGTPNVTNNPVVVATGVFGDIVNAIEFEFQDGSSVTYGGGAPGGKPSSYSYTGEILSSIHINGVSQYYGSADCVVFGFQYPNGVVTGPDAQRIMAITRLPNRLPPATVDAVSLAEFESQHEDFWKSIRAKAQQNEVRA
jgi:delta endotoxin, N-terminal domain